LHRNFSPHGVLPNEYQTQISYSSSPQIAPRLNLDYCMHIQHLSLPTMNLDEDTCEWLGLPSPLEMYQQHCLLLENEIQELNLLLSKARADIFGLVLMLDEARAKKDEFAGYLRQRGSEAAAMRKQISDLTSSAIVSKREADNLRLIVNELRSRPTTIV